MQHYIGGFKVSMHRVNFMQAFETVENMFQEGRSFLFWKLSILIKILLEVATIAILHNDEGTVGGRQIIDEFHHVLVVTLTHDSYLGSKELQQFGIFFQVVFWNNFNGDWLLLFRIVGLVNSRPLSFSDFGHKIVSFYPFANQSFNGLPLH